MAQDRKSLLQRMLSSSANTPRDGAVFQFLREIEMLDREWGEQYGNLRSAKNTVIAERKGNIVAAIRKAMEALYDMLDTDLPESVRGIIKTAIQSGRKVIDVVEPNV